MVSALINTVVRRMCAPSGVLYLNCNDADTTWIDSIGDTFNIAKKIIGEAKQKILPQIQKSLDDKKINNNHYQKQCDVSSEEEINKWTATKKVYFELGLLS